MTQTYVTDVSKPTVPPLDPPERLLMGRGRAIRTRACSPR
jgi:hypothetical protein